MPEEKEPPRPHGDKLMDRGPSSEREENDRDADPDSSANGVPVVREDDGALRKRQYKNGADLVSGMD